MDNLMRPRRRVEGFQRLLGQVNHNPDQPFAGDLAEAGPVDLVRLARRLTRYPLIRDIFSMLNNVAFQIYHVEVNDLGVTVLIRADRQVLFLVQ